MIRNFDRRYEIQKIHRGYDTRDKLVECYRNAKIRNARTSTRIMFARECSVFGLFATEKNTSLRFTVRNKGATGARSTPKRANARKKTYADHHFSFFLSLSLLLSFFSSVEYNSSPCSKILKIVVPADVSQWH